MAVVNDAERPFRVVTCDPRTERRAVGYGWGGGWGGQRSQIIEAWQP